MEDKGAFTKRKRKAEEFRRKNRQTVDGNKVDTVPTSPESCPTSLQYGKTEDSARKYILFVGNLPYTTSREAIMKHFAKVKPDIRIATCKGDVKKCKGFAFLQFEGQLSYERFSTALEYHHTLLDGRKINVELTGGGGGGSKYRKEKIVEKNQRLQEARQKKIIEHQHANESKTKVKRPDLYNTHPERRQNIS